MAKRRARKSDDVQVVETNGSMPDGYSLIKREATYLDRGIERTETLGYVITRKTDRRTEFAGRTNCWHPKEVMADPPFPNEHEAAKVARYMHEVDLRNQRNAASNVEVEIKELLVPIASELPSDAPRQIKITMTREEACRLKAVFLACRKENVTLYGGKPVTSMADAFRYITSLL